MENINSSNNVETAINGAGVGEKVEVLQGNLAFAPFNAPNGLYDDPGVDIFRTYEVSQEELEAGESPVGEPLSWHEYMGGDGFDEEEADAMLHELGYRRITPWDHALPEYSIAEIEGVH